MSEDKQKATDKVAEQEPGGEGAENGSMENSETASPADAVTIPADDYAALKEKAEERDRFFQQLQRTVADYDNYQKRVKRDRPTWETARVRRFFLDFLPALDDLGRILAAVEEDISRDEIVTVLRLLGEKFNKICADWKVERIPAEGEPFDPNLHEALRQEPTEELDAGSILAEIRKGYTLDGTVLRAAQVVVAASPVTPDDEDEAEEDGA